jgi:hypothetical protein
MLLMLHEIRNYAELQELIRVSLRIQHPEWVDSDGNSPTCDFYDARFAGLLGLAPSREDEAEPPVGDGAEKAKNNAQRWKHRVVNHDWHGITRGPANHGQAREEAHPAIYEGSAEIITIRRKESNI